MSLRSTSDAAKLIVFGTLLLILCAFGWFEIYAEYRGMGAAPQAIDLPTTATPEPNRGRWVTVPEITVECDNRAVESGRSAHTLYVAHAPGSARVLVIDAGAGRSACQDIPRANLHGVLRPLTNRRRDYLEGRGLRIARPADALVLTWGETPKSSRVLLLLLPFAALGGFGMVIAGVGQLRRRVRCKVAVNVHHTGASSVI